MTNGDQQGTQNSGLLVSLPPEYKKAERLHNDFTRALTEYRKWITGQEQKIMLWTTIRSVLLEAENGQGSMTTQDVLEALGSDRANIENLTWAEKTLLETEVGQVRGSDTGEADVGKKIIEWETLLRQYQETTISDTVPFFYFGWKLVLRKILVEYHAQRLRIYLYTGELDEKRYPAMATWQEFRKYAEKSESDAESRITRLLGDYLSALNSHGVLTSTVDADSAFFERLSEENYDTQLDLILQLSFGLSSSFIGQRLLADLAWGYYGNRRSDGTYQRFKFVDFFRKPANQEESVVNWDEYDAVSDFFGLNQQSLVSMYLAVQIAPGYHRAVAMARDTSDISTAELERIESEAAIVLGEFTKEFGTATSDGALPTIAEQNSHSTSNVKNFLQFIDKGRKPWKAISGKVIADWAQATGIKEELGFGPSETVTIAKIETLPDKRLEETLERGWTAADTQDPTYPKWAAERSIAVRRFLIAYSAAANTYGAILFFTADARDSSTQQTLEDINTFAGLGTDLFDLFRTTQGDEIDWEKIDLGGTTEGSWRPVKTVNSAEQIKEGLSTLNSNITQTLIADMNETVKHLNKLEATVNVIEYNAIRESSTASQFTLTDLQKNIVETNITESRKAIHETKGRLVRFRSLFEEQELDAAVEELKGGKLNATLKSTDNALVGVVRATETLTENAIDWSVSGVESKLLDPGDMESGAVVDGETHYQQLSKVDVNTSPLHDASLRTWDRLSDLVELDLGSEEMADMFSTRGLDQRAGRLEAIHGWFMRHGTEADLEYTMRTAELVDGGIVMSRYKPSLVKFGARVVVELVGTVAEVLDLIINTMNTIKSWNKGDHSAAGGFALQVIGTGVMILASGPIAWVGIAVLIAGIALVAFTTDSDLTVWIRHTFFGRLWLNPASTDWNEEYNRWGSYLGTVLRDAVESLEGEGALEANDGESPTGGLTYPTAWSFLSTYSERARDPDLTKYFASQLAWFYEHAVPFEVPTARLGRDDEGFPMLTVTVEDPAWSGKQSDTFKFNSILLFQPVVFTTPSEGARSRAWRMPPMAVQLTDDLRTYQRAGFTWTEPNIKGLSDPDVTFNSMSGPRPFSLAPQEGFLQYDVLIEQYATPPGEGTIDPQNENVWIDTITCQISLNDEFKADFATAFAEGDPEYPLNWLFGGIGGVDLLFRLGAPDRLSSKQEPQFTIKGEVLQRELGIEVYHVPPELVKATLNWCETKGENFHDALRRMSLNPFATRVGEFVTVPGDFADHPPEWTLNI